MTVPSTSNSAASAAAAAAAAATGATNSTQDSFTNPTSNLTQNDFLQLLVAQIQYQDPMNPQSDTQMASQMAQFTSLQQATQSTSSLGMMQANSLVGSNVTVQIDSQHTANGVVTGVVLNNGTPQITVSGQNYGLNQVTSILPPTASPTSTPSASTPSSSGN
jgi:flagellar basal-body rod modification protein FlgD